MIKPAQNRFKHAIAATRYPPEGVRGVSVSHRGNKFSRVEAYFQHANPAFQGVRRTGP